MADFSNFSIFTSISFVRRPLKEWMDVRDKWVQEGRQCDVLREKTNLWVASGSNNIVQLNYFRRLPNSFQLESKNIYFKKA